MTNGPPDTAIEELELPVPSAALLLAATLTLGLFACGGSADGWGPASGAPTLQTVTHVWAFSEHEAWFLDGGPTGLHDPSGLWAASHTDVWAIDDGAFFAHYDGTDWTGVSGGPSLAASLWGSGPDDVYAVGTFDVVHYDGARRESVVLPGGGGGGDQVWGTGASNVWVLSGSSELYHFDGSAWQVVERGGAPADGGALLAPVRRRARAVIPRCVGRGLPARSGRVDGSHLPLRSLSARGRAQRRPSRRGLHAAALGRRVRTWRRAAK